MLADALDSDRMFVVAMQKPGHHARRFLSPIAGLGLIRVCVRHKNDTSHLVLHGIARVKLEETVRYKPYRVQRIRPLETPPCDSVTADALRAKVRELLWNASPWQPIPKYSGEIREPEPDAGGVAGRRNVETTRFADGPGANRGPGFMVSFTGAAAAGNS